LLVVKGAGERGGLEGCQNFLGRDAVADPGFLAFYFYQTHLNRRGILTLQVGGDIPVFLRYEAADFFLAIADDAHGHRLYAPGAESPSHLFPENGTELVAYQPVQDAPGLLGLVFIEIKGQRFAERLQDRLFRQIIEKDAPDLRFFGGNFLGDMPGNGFSFPVGIGGQIDKIRLPGRFFQVGHHLLFGFHNLVGGIEIIINIYAQLAFRQVLDMPDGGHDIEFRPQVFFDGFYFRR
jgi:hypothetical protein